MEKHCFVAFPLYNYDHIERLKSSLQIYYGCHQELIDRYEIFISERIIDRFPIT